MFEILRRHTELRYFVINKDDAKIDTNLWHAAGKRRVDKLIKRLVELDAVTETL